MTLPRPKKRSGKRTKSAKSITAEDADPAPHVDDTRTIDVTARIPSDLLDLLHDLKKLHNRASIGAELREILRVYLETTHWTAEKILEELMLRETIHNRVEAVRAKRKAAKQEVA